MSPVVAPNSADAMRELLMLAYHYPPADHTGTRRMTAFARYLPASGYRPVVLTTNVRGTTPTDVEQRIFRASELTGLLARPYRALRLRRVSAGQRANTHVIPADSRASLLLNAWMIPDIHITWLPFAVRLGFKLLRERPIKLIFSSSPPTTSHLVALTLKRLTGLPWVADFRDGWMFEPANPAPLNSRSRMGVELALERSVVLGADRIVTVNQHIADDLRRRYPRASGRICVISNGYDPGDFAEIVRAKHTTPKLRLVHTGSFTLSRASTSIEGLITAMHELRSSDPELSRDLELVLVGQLTMSEESIIARAGLGEQVRLLGRVSHREALQRQADADLLLLVTVPGESSVTTSKLFEYLAVGRPILALTGPSSAAAIIRDLDAGVIVAPDDVAGIQAALRELHGRWRNGDLPTYVHPRVAEFSRPVLTEQLARLFNDLSLSHVTGPALP